MRSADLRILQTARRWAETLPIWLCTLLRTYGSSPRPPAAMMVITGGWPLLRITVGRLH